MHRKFKQYFLNGTPIRRRAVLCPTALSQGHQSRQAPARGLRGPDRRWRAHTVPDRETGCHRDAVAFPALGALVVVPGQAERVASVGAKLAGWQLLLTRFKVRFRSTLSHPFLAKYLMSAFTKSLAELLRPFYNWTADKMEGTISELV
jgi:hypothetical protein